MLTTDCEAEISRLNDFILQVSQRLYLAAEVLAMRAERRPKRTENTMLIYDYSEWFAWFTDQPGGMEIMVKLTLKERHDLLDIMSGFHMEVKEQHARMEREATARRTAFRAAVDQDTDAQAAAKERLALAWSGLRLEKARERLRRSGWTAEQIAEALDRR